jgi:ribosomal protein S19
VPLASVAATGATKRRDVRISFTSCIVLNEMINDMMNIYVGLECSVVAVKEDACKERWMEL